MAYDFTAASSQYLSMTSSPVSGPPITMACWFNADQVTTSDYLMAVASATNTYFALAIFGANAGDPVGAFDFSNSGPFLHILQRDTLLGSGLMQRACGVA